MNRATESVGTLLLSLSEQRRALDNAAIMVESDPRGIITYVNDKFCEISGYSREELLGRDHRFLNSGHHPPEFFAKMWSTIKEGRVWRGEVCNRTKSGGIFWVDTTITPIVGQDGQPAKYIAVRFDITERKLAEDILRQQAQIIDQSHDAVFSMDLNGTLVSWNRGAERLFGYSRDEVVNRPCTLLCRGKECDRRGAGAIRALRESGGGALETRMVRKSGEPFFAHLALSLLRNSDGIEIGMVGYAIDISARKEAEREIEQSREQLRRLSSHLLQAREEEKAHIAREIHDELGGTLTALKMDIFWLAKKLPKEPAALQEKAEAMSALVDSAVQCTRRICTELRPTILDDLGLVAAIDWQAREYEKRTGIACALNLAEGEMALDGNRSIALFRILQESLTNITRHACATRVEIDLRRDGDSILMQIKDNGVGISQDKVLNPLSHGIRGMIERARDLGGTLTVSGAPGQGVAICARIPLPQTGGEK